MPKEREINEIKNGFVVRKFPSINSAAATYGLERQGINHVLAGRSTHCKGYVFEYHDPDLEGEVWVAHQIGLLVSNYGRIQYPTGKKSFGTKSFHGYMYSHYQNKKKRIHRLVLEVFEGPCPSTYECDHIDRDRANNCLGNLRWVSRKVNLANKGAYKKKLTINKLAE